MAASRPQFLKTVCELVVISALASACSVDFGEGLDLSKHEQFDRPMHLGERIPDVAEASAVGALETHVERGSAEFARLVRCDNPDIVFKDEEGTGADRMMTPRLRAALKRLAPLVMREWTDLHVRVTEAWDEKREHGVNSVHYEGRAADLTTSDVDPHKLGRLARLATDAGFDWVFYEDGSHVHVSVKR